jgi:hypothetical protein
MTVCHDKDLLSKIQSSYLWKSDDEQPDDVTVSIIKTDFYFSRSGADPESFLRGCGTVKALF